MTPARAAVRAARRRPPRTAFTWAFGRIAGPVLAAVVLAGCAGGTQPVNYLHSPTRVLPPASDPTDQGFADPVVPTGQGGTDPSPTTCALLPAADVAEVTGLVHLVQTPDNGVLCSYEVAGQSVFRLTRHDYPAPAEASEVLDATVSPYDDLEHVGDVGDAAAYVPDSGSDLPPALFVALDMGDAGAAVLRLAFDVDHEDDPDVCRQQLVELAHRAASRL